MHLNYYRQYEYYCFLINLLTALIIGKSACFHLQFNTEKYCLCFALIKNSVDISVISDNVLMIRTEMM